MSIPDQGNIPAGLRLIDVSAVCTIGEINRCIATVWAGKPTLEHYTIRNAALVELAKRHRGNAALVELVEVSSKPPDDADRKHAMEVFRQLGTDISAIGFVMEGNSWRISIARAVIQSMSFIVPHMQPTKVFKHPAPMLGWIAQYLKDTAPDFTTRTIEAMEYLRRRLHAERSSIAR